MQKKLSKLFYWYWIMLCTSTVYPGSTGLGSAIQVPGNYRTGTYLLKYSLILYVFSFKTSRRTRTRAGAATV